jgi:hypothetical protein
MLVLNVSAWVGMGVRGYCDYGSEREREREKGEGTGGHWDQEREITLDSKID